VTETEFEGSIKKTLKCVDAKNKSPDSRPRPQSHKSKYIRVGQAIFYTMNYDTNDSLQILKYTIMTLTEHKQVHLVLDFAVYRVLYRIFILGDGCATKLGVHGQSCTNEWVKP
jgi:hypothetical protein